MKCLILAGGRGERLWPLSRTNFPKQFINIRKNHSIFQETVARNMAFCDEFIIVTNVAYRPIIANQMEFFQGVSYRCVFEEEPRKTLAAIALGCKGLQPSELVFVVAADHLVDTGDCKGLTYKDAILRAKDLAREGKIAIFGKPASETDPRFGYFTENAEAFFEKPDKKQSAELWAIAKAQGERCRKKSEDQETAEEHEESIQRKKRKQKDRESDSRIPGSIESRKNEPTIYQNLGMLLFQSGTLFNELKTLRPELYRQIKAAKGTLVPEGILYTKDIQQTIDSISIENAVVELTGKRAGIGIGFDWSDIGSLEDLEKTEILTEGTTVTQNSNGARVINHSPDQAVVVNDIDDVLVVNTADAVYIGKKGSSTLLKGIIRDNPALEPYMRQGKTVYRPWGYYVQLTAGEAYSVRKVVILPGKTIYEHIHDRRTENWSLLEGDARVIIDNTPTTFTSETPLSIPRQTPHQISNIGDKPLQMIETDMGEIRNISDMRGNTEKDVTEVDLGLKIDPLIRLDPAYRDYLWGGTRLRDLYHKPCDYDIIAESWELSAHPDGNSIVASGRHRGFPFQKYLKTIGREALGWKCAPLQAFPLLIKFIDAKQKLSVQVHPDDDYALEHENEYGKNEMWYVIDAEPGAGLFVGFNQDVTKETVRQRIENNTIEEVLNFCPTHPGDIFFIPTGTVHAIGAGNLICEIQQSSNSTYRLYDYDRRDKYGNPRELHLDKALDVLDCTKYKPTELIVEEQNEAEKHIRCKYFEATILTVSGEKNVHISDDSFRSLVCIQGEGTVSTNDNAIPIPVRAGDSFFIPAADRAIALNGEMTLIIASV